MQSTPNLLKAALAEVRLAAHNQDLVEVPKQAELDRVADNNKAGYPLPASAGKRDESNL